MRWAVALVALVTLAGCEPTPVPLPTSPGEVAVFTDAELTPLLGALPQASPGELDPRRLAPGLTPPTNRWYSGLVFGAEPQPVFALPLSFALTSEGFAVGLPQVSVSPAAILGPHSPQVALAVGGAATVVSDDESVVVVEHRRGSEVTGRTTLAQGSPYVWWQAGAAASIEVTDGFVPVSEGLWRLAGDAASYRLRADGASLSGTTLSVPEGRTVAVWAEPDGVDPDALDAGATAVPTGSVVAFEVGEGSVTTRWSLTGATVSVRRPHQQGGECGLGTYASVLGPLRVCAGSEVTWESPRTSTTTRLDLSGVPASERERLAAQVKADVAAIPAYPADTYFGGKALQRTALLLMLADELGLEQAGDTAAASLDAELSQWTEVAGCRSRAARCFVVDPAAKGVVGLTASFGSEVFNDHHFHYGYFLLAAGVLAEHDPSSVERHRPVIDLLAADIAGAGSSLLPDRRAFDAYAGHSWASGTAPFADGNNQESISEAINAHAGAAVWGRVSGNQALTRQAEWMHAVEAAAGAAYWTSPDLAPFPGFAHQITSLVWGGKRDYATWFSPEPAAKLGILLLPLGPGAGYLAGDPDRIRAAVAEATSGGFDQPFGGYLLMYSALAGPSERATALALADSLSERAIDDGLSRSYLLAWLLSAG